MGRWGRADVPPGAATETGPPAGSGATPRPADSDPGPAPGVPPGRSGGLRHHSLREEDDEEPVSLRTR